MTKKPETKSTKRPDEIRLSSLENVARFWAMLRAIARDRNVVVPPSIIDAAYGAYVRGEKIRLRTASDEILTRLGMRRADVFATWKKLDRNAKRETSRRAFQS